METNIILAVDLISPEEAGPCQAPVSPFDYQKHRVKIVRVSSERVDWPNQGTECRISTPGYIWLSSNVEESSCRPGKFAAIGSQHIFISMPDRSIHWVSNLIAGSGRTP